jgi:hypothetical protein
MSESMLYVMYNVAPQQNGSENSNNAEALNSRPDVIATYTDILENRRNTKWPELQKALDLCRQKNVTLLISELGTLANNESFTEVLLASKVPFQCIDQPFVNQTILEALSKHAGVQRKLHGDLIRQGLKMTSAKSGNPNAAEVISKVNKPKIDTAIVFAFLLQLIIQDYRHKGYSQRHMVKTLNEEGFSAPEGGKWVLSQLQKVLDRVRLNEIATELKNLNTEWHENALSPTEIATALNAKKIAPLKPPVWDESQVKKLQDRIQQIEDITQINRFVLDLLPLIHAYQRRNLTPKDMMRELQQTNLPVREADLFESAAKHIPVYLKIIKGHIEQLAKVLELETHSHRKLENAGLAEPVVQLMQLFSELKEEDIQLLENLAREASHLPYVQTVITKESTATV